MKTQRQMYDDAHRRIAYINIAFMEMLNDPVNPLTNQDLERAIARWPERYSQFSGFIGKLKDEA